MREYKWEREGRAEQKLNMMVSMVVCARGMMDKDTTETILAKNRVRVVDSCWVVVVVAQNY